MAKKKAAKNAKEKTGSKSKEIKAGAKDRKVKKDLRENKHLKSIKAYTDKMNLSDMIEITVMLVLILYIAFVILKYHAVI